MVYTIFLNTIANSGALALLPLTIDRTVAVLLPLRHKSIITKRICVVMFVATWLPILAPLLHFTVGYSMGTITIEYEARYYRCVSSGRHSFIEELCLLFVPFLLVLLMYGIMLFIIIRTRRRCGRFLVTATGIIMTSLLAYSPSVIATTWNISLSYEVSQILTVTVFYTNGVVNPLIYVYIAHPATRNYVKGWWMGKMDSTVQSSVYHNQFELSRGKSSLGGTVLSNPLRADSVCLSNTDI